MDSSTNLEQAQLDEKYMAAAYQLALQGKVSCYPNPAVGCVIVKNGLVVGEGFHHYPGQAHAEIEAVKSVYAHFGEEQALKILKDATVYVTLEPCCHYGRTPPCALKLVELGVKRVVVGQLDYTNKVNGKGIAVLEKAGIKVDLYPYAPIALLNNDFFYLASSKVNDPNELPFIRIKVGASLDGRTALPNGESKWITNSKSRTFVQALRLHCDAVFCTAKTVIRDQALYTIRYNQLPPQITEFLKEDQVVQPTVVMVDNSHTLTPQETIFTTKPLERLIIVSEHPHPLAALASNASSAESSVSSESSASSTTSASTATSAGTPTSATNQAGETLDFSKVHFITGFNTHNPESLRQLLIHLKNNYGIKDLLVEAGAHMVGEFLNDGLFNELHYCMAPIILGQGNEALNTLEEKEFVSECMRLILKYTYQLDDNTYLVYDRQDGAQVDIPNLFKLTPECNLQIQGVTVDNYRETCCSHEDDSNLQVKLSQHQLTDCCKDK